jgi:PAS domain-containing protein
MIEPRTERHPIASRRAGARVAARRAIVVLLTIMALLALAAVLAAPSAAGGRVSSGVVTVVAASMLATLVLARQRRRRATAARRAKERDADRGRFFSRRDATPAGVLVLDALGRIESLDRGAVDVFSAVDDLAGRSVLEVLPPPAGVRPADHLAALLGSHSAVRGFGRPTTQVWDARACDGRAFAVELIVARIDAEPGWSYRATVHAVASPNDGAGADADHAPAIDLREPFGNDRIMLRYRPTFDLRTGHVTSVEAQAHLLCDDGGPRRATSSRFWERTGCSRLGAIAADGAA